MPNFSQIIITGHLGRDPELRVTPSGTEITSFSVAVKTGYGERERTTWYNVALFGKAGERAVQYLHKGAAVTVTGEFSVRDWTDKDGNKRTANDIDNARWSFAGGKGEGKAESKSAPKPAADDFEDDLPW